MQIWEGIETRDFKNEIEDIKNKYNYKDQATAFLNKLLKQKTYTLKWRQNSERLLNTIQENGKTIEALEQAYGDILLSQIDKLSEGSKTNVINFLSLASLIQTKIQFSLDFCLI